MKNNKGITLIALVVTIIVLLILAGVSIAMLTGQNGILNRASQASYESKLQDAAESMSYNVTESLTKYYNKAYADPNSTETTDASISAAILSGITDSIDASGKAKSDSTVAVTNNITDAADITASSTKTVVLTYNNHTKTGTVTTSGIAWGAVSK